MCCPCSYHRSPSLAPYTVQKRRDLNNIVGESISLNPAKPRLKGFPTEPAPDFSLELQGRLADDGKITLLLLTEISRMAGSGGYALMSCTNVLMYMVYFSMRTFCLIDVSSHPFQHDSSSGYTYCRLCSSQLCTAQLFMRRLPKLSIVQRMAERVQKDAHPRI